MTDKTSRYSKILLWSCRLLFVVWLVCPFLAIWIRPFRLHFALTAIWGFIVFCILGSLLTKEDRGTPP